MLVILTLAALQLLPDLPSPPPTHSPNSCCPYTHGDGGTPGA